MKIIYLLRAWKKVKKQILGKRKNEVFRYNKLRIIHFNTIIELAFFKAITRSAHLLRGLSYLAFCFHNIEGYNRVFDLIGKHRTLHSSEL